MDPILDISFYLDLIRNTLLPQSMDNVILRSKVWHLLFDKLERVDLLDIDIE